ncbi:hypothetical protein KP509_33G066300 [Ceratopteris richardii]|uniref:Uncharacterized protein n=1 Tax=Ceratopteris richardii TaxID=49495 RepID=A0A8T2QRP7_CERRI|nr:hypothetical protein KP509_33G066300 [Ceratopteris richardii]
METSLFPTIGFRLFLHNSSRRQRGILTLCQELRAKRHSQASQRVTKVHKSFLKLRGDQSPECKGKREVDCDTYHLSKN